MVLGALSIGAWRRLAFITLPIIALWWILADRSSLASKAAQLESQLRFTSNNAESLATQLKVINAHKEKIEKMLEEERRLSTEKTENLNRKLDSINEKYEQLQRELVGCKEGNTASSVGTAQRFKSKLSAAPVTNRYSGDVRTVDDGALPQPHSIDEINQVDFEQHKQGPNEQIPPPVHPSLLAEQQSGPTSNNVSPMHSGDVGPQHEYVGKNSVHFHRHEPADTNLEFRRSDQADAKAEQHRRQPLKRDDEDVEPPQLGVLPNANRQRPSRRPSKRKMSTKEVERGAEREEEVVDYRHDAQPDKNEDDYREMAG